MLKVVDVHLSDEVRGEYLVLQNQGLVTVTLRGWAVCTEAFLSGDLGQVADALYIFREEIGVKPYTKIVLFTGEGEDGWVPTTDGRQAYCAYWGRSQRIWSEAQRVHLLHLAGSRPVVAPIQQPRFGATAG